MGKVRFCGGQLNLNDAPFLDTKTDAWQIISTIKQALDDGVTRIYFDYAKERRVSRIQSKPT